MRKPLQIRLWVLVAVLLLVALALLGFYWASAQVPSWYQAAVAEVDTERQRRDSEEMEQRLAYLASRGHTTGRWEVLLTDEQINGWLADGLRQKHPELLPPEITEPRVLVEPDGITLAGRFDNGTTSGIVTLKVDVYLAEPNVVAARIRSARFGALPWPLGGLLDAVSTAARESEIPLRWRQTDGDSVALVTIPPAGNNKRLKVETVQLGDGELYIAGVTGNNP